MKKTAYFIEKEFDCKCGCGLRPEGQPNDELIDILVNIREHFQSPLIINSAFRCENHNKKVGGSSKSRHLIGDAVDFRIKNVETKKVYDYVISNYENYGIAIKENLNDAYKGFVHFDTRGKKARWTYK